MTLRVTLQTFVNHALDETRRQTDQLAQLQVQASSGKRLQAPSDDPAVAAVLQAGTAQTGRLQSYLDNVNSVRSTLNQSVATLQDASTVFTQAKSIALQASQSTEDSASRGALANQVDQLINRLLTDANAQNNGDYVFSGSATQTKPFTVTATDAQGRPLQIGYQGAADNTQAVVNQDQTVNPYLSGRAVFQATQRQPAVFVGSTGAQPGTGTDSAAGQATLTVRHDLTIYAPGAGVQAGASSVANDTVIGPSGANQLVVHDTSGTGASGTVSLNGGPAVAFTQADTDLRVTGPGGAVAYVNTTAITPGFNGTVALTANGALSIDGTTFTPINFSANQQLTDSGSGAVTNVNSTNVRTTGATTINHPGSYDAFQTLMALRDTLRGTTLSDHDQAQALSGLVGEIDRVNGSIQQTTGEQSATLQSLDQLQSHLQDMQLSAKTLVSNLGDADLSQVVVQMQAQQTMLQLSLYGFARTMQQSLLSYLQ